jgi:hypothetical protein
MEVPAGISAYFSCFDCDAIATVFCWLMADEEVPPTLF